LKKILKNSFIITSPGVLNIVPKFKIMFIYVHYVVTNGKMFIMVK